MRRLEKTCALIVLATTLCACGGPDESSAETAGDDVAQAIVDEVEARTGARPADDATPCEILDDELLRAHFELPDGAEVTRSPSKYSPHPLCTVTWPKPNAAEIEAQSSAAMADYLRRKMQGEEVERPSFRSTDELSLTLLDPAESAERARSQFESAMRHLSEGVTGSHEDVEVTFQADITPIEGVGDDARWAPKLRQLSVLDGDRIFHVGVNTGADLEVELETAKAVARDVASAV